MFRAVRISLLMTLSAASVPTVAPASDEDLRDLYFRQDAARMKHIAERGDVRAQWWMGLMLQNRGRYRDAITWYERAADQGDGRSAASLAHIHEHAGRNPAEAMRWYRRAAGLGDASSQVRYAFALRRGSGVTRDQREAVRWYLAAARQREGYAYLALAEMYAVGEGVERDPRRSYAFARAAEGGVDDSDVESQAKARSLSAEAVALLSPPDLRAAEQLLRSLEPDRPQGGPGGWAGAIAFVVLLAALAVAAGAFGRRTRGAGTEPST
jgi:TPR repeat protein